VHLPLTLANDDMAMITVGGLLVLGLVGILTSFVRNVYRTRAVEQTKREIAAYVAEGSMSPEDGERLIRADQKRE
jgi:hypothetical protein